MSDFQLILRDWVKTSGFLTHELVKRFFLFYPLLCIASDCYLQVQVAFQAWFETIEQAANPPESGTPGTPQPSPPEASMSTTEDRVNSFPDRDPERDSIGVEANNDAEHAIDIEEAVRSFLAEDLRSEQGNVEEGLE